MLLNRGLPLTLIALIPINVVIVYWTLVLDPATIDDVFGILSIVFNLLLLWPWRAHFHPLLVWRGRPES